MLRTLLAGVSHLSAVLIWKVLEDLWPPPAFDQAELPANQNCVSINYLLCCQ